MDRTLVFIPAWNEERSLPGVLADAHAALPDGFPEAVRALARVATGRATPTLTVH